MVAWASSRLSTSWAVLVISGVSSGLPELARQFIVMTPSRRRVIGLCSGTPTHVNGRSASARCSGPEIWRAAPDSITLPTPLVPIVSSLMQKPTFELIRSISGRIPASETQR